VIRIVVGLLLILLVLAAAAVGAATARFDHRVDGETQALVARAAAAPGGIVRADELERLPPPVRRWLEVSGVVGRERARTVRLRHRGALRASPEGAWMPAEAEQSFSVEPPGFVWHVKARMKHVLPIVGRDKYEGGHGHMLIAAAGLVKVADATGPEIDQATLLRFLGEIVWFPSAALAPYITWEAIDAQNAEATMRYEGVEASARFSFDERGRFRLMSAERYLSSGGRSKLEKWAVPVTSWKVVRGIEIPVEGNVTWKLAGGDFDYYRWEILDVEYR
jgi:hypothetical protein